MKNRSWILATAALALAGCVDDDLYYAARADGEIVFGVAQTKAPDGRVTTSATWDILTLGGRGTSITGIERPEGNCWSETLPQRIGRPRVDRGLAMFTGGKLPAEGLRVVANQVDVATFDGVGWATGDTLVFESQGFAAPDVQPSSLVAPSTELDVKAPAPGDLTLSRDADLDVSWDPGPSPTPGERVVVSITSEAGEELRCFFPRPAGLGQVPRNLFARFPPAARGTLEIKTHRQISGVVRSAWIVYVVASVSHRTSPFVFDR